MNCVEARLATRMGQTMRQRPAWVRERRKLKEVAGKAWRSHTWLFGKEKEMKAGSQYVRETGRVRWRETEEEYGMPEDRLRGMGGVGEDGQRDVGGGRRYGSWSIW